MAVKLRLRRLGRKKRPFYRIIAADSRSPRDGRFIEEIGYYNPLDNPATVELQEERVHYWLSVGAIPSKTVKNILSKRGIILKFDLEKRGFSEEKIEEELKKWEVLQLERERRREAEKVQKESAEKEKAVKVETEGAVEETAKVEIPPEKKTDEPAKVETESGEEKKKTQKKETKAEKGQDKSEEVTEEANQAKADTDTEQGEVESKTEYGQKKEPKKKLKKEDSGTTVEAADNKETDSNEESKKDEK